MVSLFDRGRRPLQGNFGVPKAGKDRTQGSREAWFRRAVTGKGGATGDKTWCIQSRAFDSPRVCGHWTNSSRRQWLPLQQQLDEEAPQSLPPALPSTKRQHK